MAGRETEGKRLTVWDGAKFAIGVALVLFAGPLFLQGILAWMYVVWTALGG